MELNYFASFFVALLAILNPIGDLPLFVSATSHVKPNIRRAMAVLLGAFVAIFLIVFQYTGHAILDFFGISMPAFHIAGGVIILLMSLGMVSGSDHGFGASKTTADVKGDDFDIAEAHLAQILVPIGIPILVGPGAISTVIVYADKATTFADNLFMTLTIAIVSMIVMVLLMASDWVEKLLGANGLDIATRVLGLFLCAVAIQFILNGLGEATVGFIKPTAAGGH